MFQLKYKFLILLVPLTGAGGAFLSNNLSGNSSYFSQGIKGENVKGFIDNLLLKEKVNHNSNIEFSDKKLIKAHSENQIINFLPNQKLSIKVDKNKGIFEIFQKFEESSRKASIETVGNIFKEIKREGETSEIDSIMLEKLLNANKELKNSLDNFQKSFTSIKNWSENMKLVGSIGKNLQENKFPELQTKQYDSLTREGKQSLLVFYEKFLELQEDRGSLINKLFQSDPKLSSEEQVKSENSKNKKILEFLKKIKWGQEEKTSLDKFSKKIAGVENPYSYFMDEIEWKLFQKSSEDIKKSIKEEKQSFWRGLCSLLVMPFFQSCSGNLIKLQDDKLIIEKILDLKIGSKLLYLMNISREEIKISENPHIKTNKI